MDIVYTYYTDGIRNIDCGFADVPLFRICASKSLKSALRQKHVENVVIFTDLFGKQILEEQLYWEYIGSIENADKIKFHVIDYDLYDFDKRFWNFAKMITYTFQTRPFIHIDFDVILDANFCENIQRNISKDIYTEKVRYNYRFFDARNKVLDEFDKGNCADYFTICSGLIGGNEKSIECFRRNFDIAKEYCKKGKHENVTFEMLWGIEEYCFTKIAKELKCTIFELPLDSYIHFQGSNKYDRFKEQIEKIKIY